MDKTRRAIMPAIAAGLIGVAAFGAVAGGAQGVKAAAAATPVPAGTPKPGAARSTPTATSRPKPLTPKPVNVYVGGQLVAVGQSVGGGISRVRGQVPFAIKAPAYAPRGYAPVQLAVTPQQRGVSNGFSTLTYAPTTAAKAVVTATGFQINQTADQLPFVRSTGVVTTTVGGAAGLLDEFKAGKTDILILSWSDGAGNGYTVTTDAATSRLSRADLVRIGASLR